MENININFVALGVILSVAIGGVFKAAQVCERSTIVERLLQFDLEKLKLKTAAKLEMLLSLYRETNGNMEFPEEFSFKNIVDHAFIMDETLENQILGLTQIHLDLISKGTSSSYFVEILNTYGHIIS